MQEQICVLAQLNSIYLSLAILLSIIMVNEKQERELQMFARQRDKTFGMGAC